jgi:pimeloyl-ACP methyl ester carboxylesterase
MKTRSHPALHVEVIGEGPRVVLVHGSLADGASEWVEQRSLADKGFELVIVDRRGYGLSPSAHGEDFLIDADDIAELLGDGAHVVGHSYGGVGALLGAARRPEAVRSLTVLEPAAGFGASADPAWLELSSSVAEMWHSDLPDEQWVVQFLRAVGSDPDEFPPEMLETALPLVPLLRNGRAFNDVVLPVADLRNADFPKVVVSGGHHPGFDAMCADLANRIGGEHHVIAGAGHEIQFTGEPLNDLLLDTWR